MHLLPSEQKERVVEAIKEFEDSGELDISEPCDCGSRIRHHNGGNYHDKIYLQRDGEVYVKYDTTCELTPPAEWEPCEDWKSVIEQHADWL
jgi:hypothetical protein